MTAGTQEEQDHKIDLAELYRPVALGAVRAALCVGAARKPLQARPDSSRRLLTPESLPD